ncbi:hypothetical protein K1Y77_03720 [Halomonas qaidamensis]|uniref:DUF883 domain-containing protein n=1 Tax=Halomonas qaidamensis TaxID=2866211 RepID=A0ABY6JSC3_9GAMM|nr:hypothetical protein [Halomonas qaidamensis]UYV19795.1 hypothetical protein K1Y77_03720 [Halomonas qaidamensis]
MTEQGKHHPSHDYDSLKQKGQESAAEIKDAAEQQAENAFAQQRESAAEQTKIVSAVFQKAADEFDRQKQPFCSQQTRRLAQKVDRFSQTMRDKDLHGLCKEAENYGRKEPALFIGGAIAAGFLVTRFLRSSSTHSDAANNGSQHQAGEHNAVQSNRV